MEVVDLDDLATREAAAADPATFVSGPAPVCIDEYQYVPDLLDSIQKRNRLFSYSGYIEFMSRGTELPGG